MTIDLNKSDLPSWISVIARLGFVAKGIIYASVGVLAFQIAIGVGGSSPNATEILRKFIYKPFGTALLIFCLVGLLAHSIWKFVNGFKDVEDMGNDFSGSFFRAVEIIVGFLYLSFSYATYQILTGQGAKSGDKSTQIWIAKILALPYGKWIVFGVALVTIFIGGYQFYAVFSANFDFRFDMSRMEKKKRKTLRQMGRIGMGAWGIVYFMIAFLFYQAAMTSNPQQAGGLGDALSSLASQPYGPWILGVTSVGLIIYGLYLLVLSYYHEIHG